jgi:ABC-type Fe3+ transport system permease subunit
MVSLRRIFSKISQSQSSGPSPNTELVFALVTLVFVAVCLYLAFGEVAYAASTKIPGTDASDQLEAAGTLLRIIDTGLFKWGARIFAGICIMSSGWALKEQRFGIAIICVVGAIIFGTAPTWVKNIFEIGGGNGVFSQIEQVAPKSLVAELPSQTEGQARV